jgi:hypothetical protein
MDAGSGRLGEQPQRRLSILLNAASPRPGQEGTMAARVSQALQQVRAYPIEGLHIESA